jgi:hypothetical protein
MGEYKYSWQHYNVPYSPLKVIFRESSPFDYTKDSALIAIKATRFNIKTQGRLAVNAESKKKIQKHNDLY